MSQAQVYSEELGLGEVISDVFDIYKKNFSKFLIFFLPFELAIGLITAFTSRLFVLPSPLTNPLAYFDALIPALGLVFLITLVFTSVATGLVIKFTSVYIEKGSAELGPAVRFALSRLVWILAVTVLVGIVVGLGIFVLLIPGIILGIMFCLAIPAVVIEPTGVLGSMGRARELVAHRWLKTFGLLLAFGVIVSVLSLVIQSIAGIFGAASWIVSSALGALYVPLLPIALTVYYYSNVARLSPPSFPSSAPPFPSGRYCRFCGAPLNGGELFCPACGTRQSS